MRKFIVLDVFCIWHISNIGRAVDRRVRSTIFVPSRLNVWLCSIICCVRAVFACVMSVGVFTILFTSDLCPLIRFLSWFVVIPI